MNKSNWKGRERIFARFFGGERNPLSGMNAKHTSGDIIHETLYGEYKHHQKTAIIKLWKEVEAEAKKENKIPVIGLSEKGMKGFLVICRAEDMKKIAGEVK
jgi:hypothetical protein